MLTSRPRRRITPVPLWRSSHICGDILNAGSQSGFPHLAPSPSESAAGALGALGALGATGGAPATREAPPHVACASVPPAESAESAESAETHNNRWLNEVSTLKRTTTKWESLELSRFDTDEIDVAIQVLVRARKHAHAYQKAVANDPVANGQALEEDDQEEDDNDDVFQHVAKRQKKHERKHTNWLNNRGALAEARESKAKQDLQKWQPQLIPADSELYDVHRQRLVDGNTKLFQCPFGDERGVCGRCTPNKKQVISKHMRTHLKESGALGFCTRWAETVDGRWCVPPGTAAE